MDVKRIGCGVGTIILNEEGKILLGLRNYDPDKADSELHEEWTWTLPGGNIEYGEIFYESAKREIKEETNLDVDVKDLEIICVQNDMNQFAHYISLGMICHKYSGTLKIMEPDEIIEWKWFDFNHLPPNLFSCAKKTIMCYLQKKICID